MKKTLKVTSDEFCNTLIQMMDTAWDCVGNTKYSQRNEELSFLTGRISAIQEILDLLNVSDFQEEPDAPEKV